MVHDSVSGPSNYRDASNTSPWTKPPTVIQAPVANERRPHRPRANENPYRLKNDLPSMKRVRPGNPNINQTVLAKPPSAFGLGADSQAYKRQRLNHNIPSSRAIDPRRGTFEFDVQEIEPPRLSRNPTNPVRDDNEVIDLQTSSDDLGEPVPRATKSSSPDPILLKHPFDIHPAEYNVVMSNKGKGRAKESVVVEGSEEEEDIEQFPSSPNALRLSDSRRSMAIPKDIVKERKTRYENVPVSAPAAIRHQAANSVDLITNSVVAKMKKKDEGAPGKQTGSIASDNVGTSSSNFFDSSKHVLPLEAWCLGYHLFRHSESMPLRLEHNGITQEIKVTWGRPPDTIKLRLDRDVDRVKIVNDGDNVLKENVVVQFSTTVGDNWKKYERKFKGFRGGGDRHKGLLTFRFSPEKDRGFSATDYQKFVTRIRKAFQASAVEIIGPNAGRATWNYAAQSAEMFDQAESRKGKGDEKETIADEPSVLVRSATPCSSASVKTRMSHPEGLLNEISGPSLSRRRSARQSAKQPSRTPPPAQVEPDEVVLLYPPTGPGSLNVMQSDLRRLHPEEYLNDTLIEFGLKLWLNELREKDPALADQIHVFSSFFYKKLNNRKNPEDGYKSVRKWTSKVPLFDKKYVIVPINENLHWYLAIIYEPGHTLEPPLPSTQISTARVTRKRMQQRERAEATVISEHTEILLERSSPAAQTIVSSTGATRVTTPSTAGNNDMDDVAITLFDKSCSATAESRPISPVPFEIQMRDPSPVPDLLHPPSDNMEVDVDVSVNNLVSIDAHEFCDVLEPSTPSGVPTDLFYGSNPDTDAIKPVTVDNEDGEDQQQEAEVDDMLAVTQCSSGDSLSRPYIFTLDSLGTRHPQAIRVLKDYLVSEAKDKRGFDQVREAVGKQVQVPVQPNTWDCGIYLLHFVKVFMSDPSSFLEKILTTKGTMPSSDRKKMWQDHEIPHFRDNLRSRIMQLSEEWKTSRGDEVSKRKSEDAREVEALSSDGEVDIVEGMPSAKATSRKKQPATRLRG